MIIPVSEYLTFLVAMYGAGMRKEVEEALLIQKGIKASRTVDLTPTPRLWEVYGHIKDVSDLTHVLKTQVVTPMVVDGTKPIRIGSDTKILGKHDTAVTPALQRIVTAVDRELHPKAWEIVFEFALVGTLIKCNIRGRVSTRPGAVNTVPPAVGAGGVSIPAAVRSDFTGVTFGPTVKDCIEAAEGMILNVLG